MAQERNTTIRVSRSLYEKAIVGVISTLLGLFIFIARGALIELREMNDRLVAVERKLDSYAPAVLEQRLDALERSTATNIQWRLDAERRITELELNHR